MKISLNKTLNISNHIGCATVRMPAAVSVGDTITLDVAIINSGYGLIAVNIEELGGEYHIRSMQYEGTIINPPAIGITHIADADGNVKPVIVIGDKLDYTWLNSTIAIRAIKYSGDSSIFNMESGWVLTADNIDDMPSMYLPCLIESVGGVKSSSGTISRNVLEVLSVPVGSTGPFTLDYSIGQLDVSLNGYDLSSESISATDGKTFKLKTPTTIKSVLKAVGFTGLV